MRPLVTIPIAAYKSRPDYLAATIESALAQSWQNVDIIVSDDSPDDSLRPVVERFADRRVTYRHNAQRMGVAENHWATFRNAQGEFIAVMNHDDLYAPEFLEKLITPLLADPCLALAFCDHWVIDADGQRLVEESDRMSAVWGRNRLNTGPITPFFHLFAAKTIPMVMGTVFRKSALPQQYPENAGPAYDLWLSYLLCRTGHGAYYVPDRLSSWRVHKDNLTSLGNLDWSIGIAECWSAAHRDPNLVSVRHVTRQQCALAYYNCAVKSWRAGRRWDTLRYGWQSITAQPTVKGLKACLLPLVPTWLVERRPR